MSRLIPGRLILVGVATLVVAGLYVNRRDVVNRYYMTSIWVRVNWLNQQPLIAGGDLKPGARVVRFDWPVMMIDEPTEKTSNPG